MTEHSQTRKPLSRRAFVKKTLTGIGATALVGTGTGAAEAANAPRHWDKAADVVVIGAGATGLPASIEAAEQGASVIVVEQN